MDFIKYVSYWRTNYSVKYVLSNIFRIHDSFNTIKEISEKYDIMDEYHAFYKRKATFNRLVTEQYIGEMVRDWKNRRGRNYMDLVQRIFKDGEKR